MIAERLIARTGPPLTGAVPVPGDKSLSHRALIFGAMAVGESRVTGLLESDDVLATAAALRSMGADIERQGDGAYAIWGRGVAGFAQPSGVLDLGNSGTGARLLMGVAAQQPIRVVFAGDASLCSRPMGRVMDPLTAMGVRFEAREGGRLPATLIGPKMPRPIDYRLPVASAQVKSAILLAAFAAPGTTIVREPVPTRDHTERMAQTFGAQIEVEEIDAERVIRLTGGAELRPANVIVPADPSSAAFPIVAGLLVPGSDILVRGVLMNPSRAGLYETLREMGADLSFENDREEAGEKVADIRAKASHLKGVDVPPVRAASMIDEYPVLAVAAAFAKGTTRMHGVGELRVKESDRLAACAAGLGAIGIKAKEGEDSLTIEGADGDVPGGGTVTTHMDHRIAMAFLIAGLASAAPVKVDDGAIIATSFPGFRDLMASLGAHIERANG